MKKPFFSLSMSACVLMMCVSLSPFVRAAQDADGEPTSKLVTIFWGIVGYTHWPDMEGPLRICLSEDDSHSGMIRRSARSIKLGRQVAVRSMPANVASACDIVYVSGAGEAGGLPRSLVGKPVLTIGDGGKFCSTGGMFCLLSDGNRSGEKNIDRFAVNLDAISRSPLRISPRVLRLSKRNQEH